MTKLQIFNLALGALSLSRRVSDTTAVTNENNVLNTNYDMALSMTLEDMDLDATSSEIVLALLATDPTQYLDWSYVYAYPTNCAFFRRIKSPSIKDNRSSRIPLRIAMFNNGVLANQKAIFTNEVDAIGEYITTDFPLSSLSSQGGLAVAYRLAWLSAPLITGKGSDRLKKEIMAKYMIAKSEAQEMDLRENFNYEDDVTQSEFAEARLE